jgi:hypothetical protein
MPSVPPQQGGRPPKLSASPLNSRNPASGRRACVRSRPPRRNVIDERELRGNVAQVLRVAIGVDRGLTAATKLPPLSFDQCGLVEPELQRPGPRVDAATGASIGASGKDSKSHRTAPPIASDGVAGETHGAPIRRPSPPATTSQNAGPERRRLEPNTLGYRRVRDSRQIFVVHTDRRYVPRPRRLNRGGPRAASGSGDDPAAVRPA